MSDRCRNSRDPFESAGSSEFSWGPGLVPHGYEYAPPSQGGMYRGTCPPVELTPSHDLSVRVTQATGHHGRRPDGSPNGYPGERVG
jgi:hypothetical protein